MFEFFPLIYFHVPAMKCTTKKTVAREKTVALNIRRLYTLTFFLPLISRLM